MSVKNKQLLYEAIDALNMDNNAVAIEITNYRVDINDMPVIVNQFSEKRNKKGKYKRDWE